MENMDNYNQYGFDSDYARASSGLTLNQYVAKTFLWMFVGLMVTFGTAYLGYWSGLLAFVFLTPMVPVLLLVAELAVVLVLSARIHKLHVGTARVLFLLYAVLNGVVFSTYFLMFEMATLIYIFALTAVYFGIFALYGRFTKRNLSGFRPFIIGGLIFLLVVSVLSLFLPLGGLDRIVCLIGIWVSPPMTAKRLVSITWRIKVTAPCCKGHLFSLPCSSIWTLSTYSCIYFVFLPETEVIEERDGTT